MSENASWSVFWCCVSFTIVSVGLIIVLNQSPYDPKIAFIRTCSWNGSTTDRIKCAEIASTMTFEELEKEMSDE